MRRVCIEYAAGGREVLASLMTTPRSWLPRVVPPMSGTSGWELEASGFEAWLEAEVLGAIVWY